MVNGSKVLDEATNAASERLILRLRRSPKIVPGASSFPSTTGASSSTTCASSPTAAASSPTAAASSIEEKLNSYIKSCKDKSRKHGFNLQTQVHEVLAKTRYKTSRAFEEEEAAPPIDAINPKRRKQKIPSFSLV